MASGRASRWVKRSITLIVLGGLVGGGAWYFARGRNSAPQYQTVPVARGDLTQVVTATGQIGPVVNVQVGSQISGIIKKLFVDYNSVVKSNQVIAEIDPSTYKVNVLKAEAELSNARSNLAQAQVQTSEAALEHAKVDLSRCTISAPVDGVVISRNVDVGQTVAASFNTPTLFVIANDLTKMQIDALVSEADIGGVEVGQAVNFTVDAYPYRTFRGKLSQIRYGAMTNQNVVNYDCVVEVNNADLKLLPGITANVSIIVAERQNAFKIPNAALRFRPPEAVIAETKTNAALRAPVSAAAGRPNGEGGGRVGSREGGPGQGSGRRAEGGGGDRPAG